MASSPGGIRRALTVGAAGLITLCLTATGAGAGCRVDASQLIYSPSGTDSAQNPAFSPDATTIVFTEFHSGYNRGASGVLTLTPPAVSVGPLLDEFDQNAVNLPGSAWNAATNRIVFASDRLDNDEVWTVAPDATALVRVTHQSASLLHFQEPSFSPDGQWIVFEAVGAGPDNLRRDL